MIITESMLNQKVPKDKFPTRLDSALNLYTYTERGLLVYNVNPATWNCLYPFFELNHKFTVDDYEFSSRDMTYAELISEYQNKYKTIYENDRGMNGNRRKEILLDEFKNTFGITMAKISEELEPVYELKYSKSKDVWTLYYFENYVVGEVDDLNKLLNQKVYEQKLMRLDSTISEIDGIEVVSNLPYILANEKNVEILKDNILK